jgi:hypothetical protein
MVKKGIETKQKSSMRATPTNKLIVADIGWAETIPDWLKTEVELERLAEAMGGVSKKGKPKEEVGDAEACLYLYTASLKAPMSNEFSRVYIYLTAKLMKRKGIKPIDFMQEKLEKGLTTDEERKLEKLKRDIYKARGSWQPLG